MKHHNKLALLCYILLFQSNNIYCQSDDILDLVRLKVHYRYTFFPDSNRTTGVAVSDMVLQIGKEISRFAEVGKIFSDSLLYSTGNTNDLSVLHRIVAYKTSSNGHIFSNYSIYKNYPTRGDLVFIHSKGNLGGNYYVKDNEKMEWTLVNHADTVILGYRCKKALTHFRGRNYIAWYSMEIPVSDGPYKFRGLPGLILLVHDTQNLHRFEIVGLNDKNVSQIYITSSLDKYDEISPKEFVKAFYSENINLYSTMSDGLPKEQKANMLKKVKSWNNFIEKF